MDDGSEWGMTLHSLLKAKSSLTHPRPPFEIFVATVALASAWHERQRLRPVALSPHPGPALKRGLAAVASTVSSYVVLQTPVFRL